MKIHKPLLSLLILSFVVACHEKTEPAKSAPDTTRPDTNSLVSSPPIAGSAFTGIDISPMDMSYYPVDYPKLKMANPGINPPTVRVIYSRPHLAKRRLFHELLKYEEPWRLGANEATEIDFYKPVTIDGKKVNPGRYIIYAIPHPKTWSIILNSNIDSWGLQQDPKKDILRFEIPISVGNPPQEYFTMIFEKRNTGADLVISWDDVVVTVPIAFTEK